jgi:hypothetical protein
MTQDSVAAFASNRFEIHAHSLTHTGHR